LSLESKDATCVSFLCERANSHWTRDFAGDADLQAPICNVRNVSRAQAVELSFQFGLGVKNEQDLQDNRTERELTGISEYVITDNTPFRMASRREILMAVGFVED